MLPPPVHAPSRTPTCLAGCWQTPPFLLQNAGVQSRRAEGPLRGQLPNSPSFVCVCWLLPVDKKSRISSLLPPKQTSPTAPSSRLRRGEQPPVPQISTPVTFVAAAQGAYHYFLHFLFNRPTGKAVQSFLISGSSAPNQGQQPHGVFAVSCQGQPWCERSHGYKSEGSLQIV